MGYSLDTLEQRIRYVRKKILAMSQKEFAEALGVSRDVISRYETGKTNLPAKQAAKMAELVHISIDWLLSGKGDVPVPRKEALVASENLALRISELEKRFEHLQSILSKYELGFLQDLKAEVPPFVEDVKRTILTKTSAIMNSLRELEAEYRRLTDDPPIGEFIFQDDSLKHVNANFAKILGYSSEDLLNKSVWNLVHPEDREMIKERALRRLKGENPPPVPFRLLKSSGEVVTVLTSVSRIEYDGRPALAGRFIILDEWNRLGQSLEKLKVLVYKELSKT